MAAKNKRKNFEDTASDIGKNITFFSGIDNARQLSNAYDDNFVTEEQKHRDEQITNLLKYYVEAYKEKQKSNKRYKNIILGICAFIILAFSVLFILLLVEVSGEINTIKTNNIIALVSVCITYLTLVIGILKIITKYVFPQKEEEYITRIVELIQRNDLKNKKANISIREKCE